MRKYFIVQLILLFFSIPLTTFAQDLPAPTANPSPFQPNKWSKSVDLIESKLSTSDWSNDKIKYTLEVLSDLQKNAKQCIRYSQVELDRINLVLAQPIAGGSASTQQVAAASLNSKEIELNDLRAECRLFLLHSQDVYTQVESLEQHLIESQIFSKGPSVFLNFQEAPPLKALISGIEGEVLSQKLGIPYFTIYSFMIMGLLVLLSSYAGYSFKSFSKRKLAQVKRNHFYHTLLAILSQYPYLLCFSVIFSIYFAFFTWPNFFLFLGQVNTYVVGYLLLLALIRVVFYPPPPAKALIVLPEPIPHEFNRRMFYLITIILGYYICSAFFKGFNLPVTVIELGMSLYLTLLSFMVISIVWLVMRFPFEQGLNKYLRRGLNIIFTLLLATVFVSECCGYHYFSLFFIKNMVLTFILSCLALGLQMVTLQQIARLKAHQQLRHHLAIRFNRSIPELDILQAVILIVIWGGLVAVLLNAWALSETTYGQLMLAITDGFNVLGFTFIPRRVLLAMIIFVFLALGNRLLQAYITRRSRYYIEEGTQVATASIIGYIGFAVALIISLIIAGVNFTGLAIIAGALSVGIGFGLQNIANNFISGLILLLDNPIRPGDRIQVGDIEGIVKRIRLRATHIYTMRHADVFIPNSELVSKSVTNFVFHDKTWSIVCSVNVEYGSDIDKVKEILMHVATHHPDVIKDEKKLPQVFFKKFGDSSLGFELWCLISDISKKNRIESDLNSAIYQAFHEHGINIPFPQTDLHIKDWPEISPSHPEHD